MRTNPEVVIANSDNFVRIKDEKKKISIFQQIIPKITGKYSNHKRVIDNRKVKI